MALTALTLASLTAVGAVSVPPCSGAPLPAAAARLPVSPLASPPQAEARGRASTKATAVPVFQAVGIFGDLAEIDPTDLLTAATFIQPDGAFLAGFVTGLAIHPGTGKVFVVGNDTVKSYLGQVDLATGQETTIGTISGEIVVDIAFDGTGKLYALTDNNQGTTPHALFAIDTATAAKSLKKVLDPHGGTGDNFEAGALAFNSADNSLYYADKNNDPTPHVFIDKVALGTFTQTPVLASAPSVGGNPVAMAFTQGKLWLFTNFGNIYSADAANLGGGFPSPADFAAFPTPDGTFAYFAEGVFPASFPCVPSTTAACLFNRFKVEVTYDATPGNGSGPANVVLESSQSVKFTFFDPTNIELILKVLNGCGVNNDWWVFAGGLTDVGVAIKVTDTSTGAVKRYNSTKHQLFQAFADTGAFGCP
ncbi:MAG TPA: hypothetical protein VHQ90_22080 [Thermoanaerobaculia bacterium]|nr:hypothetical protein [Thermoanaerobaculia bacterium]